MTARLFCHHCDKHYEVELEKIKLMQELNGDHITYSRNTYFYEGECFFKTISKLQREYDK